MTKKDLVSVIASNTGLEKVTIEKTVEAFMETVKESMVTGKNVYLRGFGSFVVKKRAKKTARNISKNTTIIIPSHNIPTFKPSEVFVRMVEHEKYAFRKKGGTIILPPKKGVTNDTGSKKGGTVIIPPKRRR